MRTSEGHFKQFAIDFFIHMFVVANIASDKMRKNGPKRKFQSTSLPSIDEDNGDCSADDNEDNGDGCDNEKDDTGGDVEEGISRRSTRGKKYAKRTRDSLESR